MMRLASFFILSVSLHAAAMVYPVSFIGPSRAELIPVTILPMAPEGGATGGNTGSGIPTRRAVSQTRPSTAPAIKAAVDTKSARSPESQALPVEPIEKVSDASVALVSAIASSVGNNHTVMSGSTSVGLYGARDTGIGGNGFGSFGAGPGRGNANGTDLSASAIALTRARYRDTPRPEYPESARRAGREGRVLLRVLVDDQGRSKRVEINSSSGSDALDRAAANAIKRWRFYPARYGDHAVESWIKIPIEFALANADAP